MFGTRLSCSSAAIAAALSCITLPALANEPEWTFWGASGPSPRYAHAMAYDTARGVVLLFGGWNGEEFLADTWEWDGNTRTWTKKGQGGPGSPSPRREHAMAYDSQSGVVVLFGGSGSSGLNDDTWFWDGSTWTPCACPGPGAREEHAMAYDTDRGVVVLFGGTLGAGSRDGETWEFQGNEGSWTWTLRHPGDPNGNYAPTPRWDHNMAYHSQNGVVVLFGGWDGAEQGDTWAWDGNAGTWMLLSTTGPSPRLDHPIAYGSACGVTVLFGGSTSNAGSIYGDTWEWNGMRWTERFPSAGPSARWGHAMAYDSDRGVVVLFGGHDGAYNGETWLYGLDRDADGVPNEMDACPCTDAPCGVDEEGRPLGDFDGDCDVDLSDFACFAQNYTGAL